MYLQKRGDDIQFDGFFGSLPKFRSGWWFGTVFIFHILGMSSSQLTFIFFRGVGIPPTRDVSHFFPQHFDSFIHHFAEEGFSTSSYRPWRDGREATGGFHGDYSWGISYRYATHGACRFTNSSANVWVIMDYLVITNYIYHMQPMVLVYESQHNWVMNCLGKCWDSCSSTMGCIWAIDMLMKRYQRYWVSLGYSQSRILKMGFNHQYMHLYYRYMICMYIYMYQRIRWRDWLLISHLLIIRFQRIH